MKQGKRIIIIVVMAIAAIVLLNQQAIAQTLDRGLISFTFDDGDRTAYTKARKIMRVNKIKPTIYVNTQFVGNNEYGTYYLTWTQLQNLNRLNGWEVANHTHSHADLTGLSEAEIINEVRQVQTILLDHEIVGSGAFAFPYGAYDSRVIDTLRSSGFLTSAREAWNEENAYNSLEYFDSWELNVIGLADYPTFADVKPFIDEAVNERKWLILLFHPIVDNPGNIYETATAVLTEIAEYAKTLRDQKKVHTVTVSEGVELMNFYQSLP